MQFLSVTAMLQSDCLISCSKLRLVELLLPDFGCLTVLTCCNSSLLLSPDFRVHSRWNMNSQWPPLLPVQSNYPEVFGAASWLLCSPLWGATHRTTLFCSALEMNRLHSERLSEPAGVRLSTRWKHSWRVFLSGVFLILWNVYPSCHHYSTQYTVSTVFHTHYLFTFLLFSCSYMSETVTRQVCIHCALCCQ